MIGDSPYPFGENAAMEPNQGAAQRSHSDGLRESLLMALLLCTLAPCAARAGNQPPSPEARRNSDVQKAALEQISAPPFPAAFALSARRAELQVFSPTEFRPRKGGVPGAAPDANEAAFMDAPMRRDTSIARELSEAKTQNRVRLLTLWQSRASSLSLQAGKRGAPSLQWSTPWMHRDAASRGLLDGLLAVSPHGFRNTGRGGGSHQAIIAPAKSLDLGLPANNR